MALVAVVLYYASSSAPSTYSMLVTLAVLKFNAWMKLVASLNIELQGVGREREEREGEEKRRTTCAHARLICVGGGSAGVHQPSCIDIVSMGAHRWGRVGGGGGSTRVVRVVGMALVAVVRYYSRVVLPPLTSCPPRSPC